MITPDSKATESMNNEINERLKQAFRYLISDVLQRPEDAIIRSTGPEAHALQFLMREAAVNDNVVEIQSLFDAHRDILYKINPTKTCEIKPLGTPELDASQCALFAAAFQDDVGLTTQLDRPTDEMVSQFHTIFSQTKQTFQQHLGDWWAELESLVKMIVLATAKDNGFGGASAFAAWGSILINPNSCTSVLSTALTIVHESSHMKLFYAYLDDEIVLNDPSARFASPLRREARPMNGIYHAAFVLARMAAFLDELRTINEPSELFGGIGRPEIEGELDRTVFAFNAAYEIIQTNGELTNLGKQIIAEAANVVMKCRKN